MILDEQGELTVRTAGEPEALRHRTEDLRKRGEVLEVRLDPGTGCSVSVKAVPVRPLPVDDSWFEATWADFNAKGIFTTEAPQ